MPFRSFALEIPDLILIEPQLFHDQRGFFLESYKKSDFFSMGIHEEFHQDITSFSHPNVIRGLHYQNPPHAQAKLIRCLKGSILDVAVDIRKNSKTYGQHVMIELSEKNHQMLYIPKGFAHGFLALTEALIHYKVSDEFSKKDEGHIRYDDPQLNIKWPVNNPILSEKDYLSPFLDQAINLF